MYFTENKDELQHHGILGQKWGIRRFQNKDGTRTAAGKKREQEGGEEKKKINIDKNKVIKGAAIAAGVTAGAIALANPTTRSMLAKYGKTTISNLKDVEKAKALGTKIGTNVGNRAADAEKAVFKSILASVSGLAVSKVYDKIKVDENASEFEKTKTKMVRDAAAAGIRAATGSKSNNQNNDNGGGAKLKSDVKEKVGEPSGKAVDKQSSKWSALFNDSDGNPRDKETKNQIREMARQGYDIDQIDKYLNHGEFEEWASQYMVVEIGR